MSSVSCHTCLGKGSLYFLFLEDQPMSNSKFEAKLKNVDMFNFEPVVFLPKHAQNNNTEFK